MERDESTPTKFPICRPLEIVVAVGILVAVWFSSPIQMSGPDWIWTLLLAAAIIGVLWVSARFPIFNYLFRWRSPILLGLILLVLPALGWWIAPRLFRNMFVLTWLDIAMVTALAFLASWSVMGSAALATRRAELRFDAKPLPLPAKLRWFGKYRIAWFSVLALPIVGTVFWFSIGEAWWWRTIGVVGGAGLAIVAFLAANALTEWLSPPEEERWEVLFPHPCTHFKRLHDTSVPVAHKLREKMAGLVASNRFGGGKGYVDKEGRLLPGHMFTLGLLIVTGIVYVLGYLYLRPPHPVVALPALFYVLLLFLVGAFLLEFATFLCDQLNVPVGVIALVFVLLYFISDTDHYYPLIAPKVLAEKQKSQLDSEARIGARDLEQSPERGIVSLAAAAEQSSQAHGEVKITGGAEQEAREKTKAEEAGEIRRAVQQRVALWSNAQTKPYIVVVAASGGGITAAYWTATVLTGLQERFNDQSFADAIHVVSAVSGGSVGAMYYLAGFDRGKAPTDLPAIRERAGRSTLSAVAWGLTYADLFRAVSLPLDRYQDRGWAMEQTWQASLGSNPTLKDWHNDVIRGHRPAVLFNATIAETGERYVLPSLALNPRPDQCGETSTTCEDTVNARTIAGLYKDADLPVTTAARLSATFPFVSPIARAWVDGQSGAEYHVADGGYYDNFGVLSLAEWLLHVTKIESAPRRILLVQIRASSTRTPENARARAGWAYATVGPILTLLNVRDSAQLARNDLDVELLQEVAKSRGFELTSAVFPLIMDAPLSWDLSNRERADIYRHWNACGEVAAVPDGKGGYRSSLIHEGLATVRTFLGQKSTPAVKTTSKEAEKFCLDTND